MIEIKLKTVEKTIYYRLSRKEKTNYDIATERISNILQCRFNDAEKPNQFCVSNITYLSFKNTRIYLISIIDLYDGSIVSYKISKTHISEDIINVIKEAVNANEYKNLVFHTDYGTQYTCEKLLII